MAPREMPTDPITLQHEAPDRCASVWTLWGKLRYGTYASDREWNLLGVCASAERAEILAEQWTASCKPLDGAQTEVRRLLLDEPTF